MTLTSRNHYSSQFYLESFSLDGKVQTYRTLVEDSRIPVWRSYSPSAIAYFRHLYTNVRNGNESDDLEKWFSREIECPARKVIDTVLTNKKIDKESWRVLARFLAAQDVRTPAYFAKFLQWSNESAPKLLDETFKDIERKLTDQEDKSTENMEVAANELSPLPIRVHVQTSNDLLLVQAGLLSGRSMWLDAIKHLLSSTWEVLAEHRWTVLMPADGLTWFTTDDPVVKLNYFSPFKYSFGGGWNSRGTEIMMPLGPEHLLYTRIGYRSPQRGHQLSTELTFLMKRIMAGHAYRFVYAPKIDPFVPLTRGRIINKAIVEAERKALASFHETQTEAEWDFLTRPTDL